MTGWVPMEDKNEAPSESEWLNKGVRHAIHQVEQDAIRLKERCRHKAARILFREANSLRKLLLNEEPVR